MSHLLPSAEHPARELFDVVDLVDVALGRVAVEWRIGALRRNAEAIFASSPAARRVAFFHLNASNDELELVSFGRRGAWRREWSFGAAGRKVRLA
jgi:hypothetical protein